MWLAQINEVGYHSFMSATELIKQVAALPPQERMLFERLLRAMESSARAPKPANGTGWPGFGERLDQIYGDKVAPDSQTIIDEGRGDH
jgi:hypothetical protein